MRSRIANKAAWILLLALCLAGCRPDAQTLTLPRPDKGYLQWLHRQSFTARADELLAEVSQTSRLWANSGSGRRWDVVLNAAPNWLQIIPSSSAPPLFPFLAASAETIKNLGFQGIFLGDVGEKDAIWQPRTPLATTPHNGVSLGFDAAFGDDDAFAALSLSAERSGLQLGSCILGAATGLGPDFFLQARNDQAASGLYAMLPAPQDLWASFPASQNEWDGQPLSPAAVASLSRQGVLPSALARDKLAWATNGGWAVTGVVKGVDGLDRRWLYRYSGDPGQAPLLWQDPSGLAKRALAASVILQTGLQGLTLVGLRMEALMGLEPEGPEVELSPGLEALNDLAAQVHRYGGWALQADSLPPEAIALVLQGNCDFCADDVTQLLAVWGLARQDSRPIAGLYQKWLKQGLDIARLARGFQTVPLPASNFINYILTNARAHAQDAHVLAAIPQRNQFFLQSLALGLPGLLALSSQNIFKGGAVPGLPPELKNMLAFRKEYSLATGALVDVVSPDDKTAGFLSACPGGEYWFLAVNFSQIPGRLDITLPAKISKARDAATGASLADGFSDHKFCLTLDSQQARNVILYAD